MEAAVESGATEFCIADTIGIANQAATYNIVKFVKEKLHKLNADYVLVHWHGHEDMGNGLGNAFSAIKAGVDKIHTVAWGIGERAGNTGMEGVMLNLQAILKKGCFETPWKMDELWNVLVAYCKLTGTEIPLHGIMSENSEVSQLGIHAAAGYKSLLIAEQARANGDEELADFLEAKTRTIYTAVDANLVGKKLGIAIGPLSGTSNVKLLAKLNDLKEPSESTIKTLLEKAKNEKRTLLLQESIQMLIAN